MQAILFFFLVLSSSWDIFANIKVDNYSFRFFYFIEIILLLLVLRKRKIFLFPGHSFFIVWMIFIMIAIPNTSILIRNLGYFFWLIFSYLLLIIIINYTWNIEKFLKYFKIYIVSFLCMAFFGLIQFTAGLLGFSLMTTQWWIEGKIPRINGLSYEPSYYGTYIVGGTALLYWLTFVEKRKIIPFQLNITLFIIFITILSSSRIAILSLLFTIFLHIYFKFILPLLKGKINLNGLKIFTLIILTVLISNILILNYISNFKIFLTGTGLDNTPSHSVNQRLQAAVDTFKVFLNNPFIGVSLGGIPSHRANLYGITISSQSEAKNFEGLNVLLEVLAASGIFGFQFFLMFWLNLIKIHRSLRRKIKTILTDSYLLPLLAFLLSISNALGIMLLVEIFALMMSPNILRPYFWVSLAFYISSLMLLRKYLNYNSS